MRALALLLALGLAAAAAGCNSTGTSLGDVGAGLGTNIGRGVDPYGTQRRPDVYYGSTRPSLPSIVNR